MEKIKENNNFYFYIFLLLFLFFLILGVYLNYYKIFYHVGFVTSNEKILSVLIALSKFVVFSFKNLTILYIIFFFINLFRYKNVKERKDRWVFKMIKLFSLSIILLYSTFWLVKLGNKFASEETLYIAVFFLILNIITIVAYLVVLKNAMLYIKFLDIKNIDIQNQESEYKYGKGKYGGFMQETTKKTTEYSLNLKHEFWYKGKIKKGWINVVNPFRAILVYGTPGSGKSFAIIEPFHKQWIEKWLKGTKTSLALYDAKFPTLSRNAYNMYVSVRDQLKKQGKPYPEFKIISFHHPSISHRCNPLKYITDVTGAKEIATNLLFSLNRSMIKNQGDFFVASAIASFSMVIFFLRSYDEKYCTLPHTLEFLSLGYSDILSIIGLYALFIPELYTLFAQFRDPWQNGSYEQLDGQIGSAKIGLTALSDENIYWALTENKLDETKNTSLDVNNPENPMIICFGNDGGVKDKHIDTKNQNDYKKGGIYGAAFSAYFNVVVNNINKQKKASSMLSVDEFASIYMLGIDQLIATARSNKVCTLLGIQSSSQLVRDYSKEQADVIKDIMGTYFAGQTDLETAKKISTEFGKKTTKKRSVSKNMSSNNSESLSYELEDKVTASDIASLSQGDFVARIADDFSQKSEYKFMYGKIIATPQDDTLDIPPIYTKEELGLLPNMIVENSNQIKKDIRIILNDNRKMMERSNIIKNPEDILVNNYFLNFSPVVDEELNKLNNFENSENIDFLDSEKVNFLKSIIHYYSDCFYIAETIKIKNIDLVSSYYRKPEKVDNKIKTTLLTIREDIIQKFSFQLNQDEVLKIKNINIPQQPVKNSVDTLLTTMALIRKNIDTYTDSHQKQYELLYNLKYLKNLKEAIDKSNNNKTEEENNKLQFIDEFNTIRKVDILIEELYKFSNRYNLLLLKFKLDNIIGNNKKMNDFIKFLEDENIEENYPNPNMDWMKKKRQFK